MAHPIKFAPNFISLYQNVDLKFTPSICSLNHVKEPEGVCVSALERISTYKSWSLVELITVEILHQRYTDREANEQIWSIAWKTVLQIKLGQCDLDGEWHLLLPFQNHGTREDKRACNMRQNKGQNKSYNAWLTMCWSRSIFTAPRSKEIMRHLMSRGNINTSIVSTFLKHNYSTCY